MRAEFIRRLAAVLGATVLFAGAAQAYSDEAVQDAQALLKATVCRGASCPPLGADDGDPYDALARYYLLEMKYKAGKVAADDFCRSAAPNLRVIADAYKPPEDEGGDLKRWQREIAAMSDSRATCDDAVTTTAKLLFGDSDEAAAPSVKDAEQQAAQMRDRFEVGEVTKADVARAQFDLTRAKYRAGQITRDAYCQSAVPDLQTIEIQVQEETRLAQRTLLDVIAAKRTLYKIKALCATSDQKEVSGHKASAPEK